MAPPDPMAAALASSLSSPPILPTTTLPPAGNKAPLLEEHPANQNPPALLETPTPIPIAMAFPISSNTLLELLQPNLNLVPSKSQSSALPSKSPPPSILRPVTSRSTSRVPKDLAVWIDASGDLPEVSRIDNGDGTASLTFLSDSEYLTSEDKLFFRLKVELN